MATLLGTKIKDTYTGLLKMDDNGAIGDLTPRPITDGSGTASALSLAEQRATIQSGTQLVDVSSTAVDINGNVTISGNGTENVTMTNTPQALVAGTTSILSDATFANYLSVNATETTVNGAIDFSAATVSGLSVPTGVALGTGTHAMITTLTDRPAVATGYAALALGRQARANADSAVAIGNYAGFTGSSGAKSIVIGSESTAQGGRAITLGFNLANAASSGIAIGAGGISSAAANGVVIGRDSNIQFASGVALGFTSRSYHNNGIAIGRLTTAGNNDYGGSDGIAIGNNAKAEAFAACALGSGVVATKASTVSVTELETQLAGGGITMKSPNGTEYKLTVSDAGALVIT